MILYHHSTTLWVTSIEPQKVFPDRDCPALIYLHEDLNIPFCVNGILPHYVYEVEFKRKPIKLIYPSQSWVLMLTSAQKQGLDLSKLYWTPKPITKFKVLRG